jgi:hypothetical protein
MRLVSVIVVVLVVVLVEIVCDAGSGRDAKPVTIERRHDHVTMNRNRRQGLVVSGTFCSSVMMIMSSPAKSKTSQCLHGGVTVSNG